MKTIKSILCAQGINKFPVEQIINNSSGIRVHSSNVTSRNSLAEITLCIRPDILIFDVSILGDKSWYQTVSMIKSKISEIGIIAVINDFDLPIIQDLAKSQVDSIIKAEHIHIELPHGIRAFQRNEAFLNPQVAKALFNSLNKVLEKETSKINQDHGLLPSLTNREMEVLACLTQGLNYKEISNKLFVSSSTVKTHVNNIFTKLNLNDRTQAVLYGLKHGIDTMMPQLFQKNNEEIISNSQPQTFSNYY